MPATRAIKLQQHVAAQIIQWVLCVTRRLFPFRKRSLPFSTVDTTTGNQAFSHDGCYIFPGLSYNKANDAFLNSLRKNSQGHPTDLFPTISVLQRKFCWLGTEVSAVLLGSKVLNLRSRIYQMYQKFLLEIFYPSNLLEIFLGCISSWVSGVIGSSMRDPGDPGGTNCRTNLSGCKGKVS